MAALCVFVAWADHELSREESEAYDFLIKDLREAGFTVYHRTNWADETHGHIVTSMEDGIQSCDCFVAILNAESYSVGYAVKAARDKGMPTLFLKPEELPRVSRTFTGLVELGRAQLQTYTRESQLLRLITEFVSSVEPTQTAE